MSEVVTLFTVPGHFIRDSSVKDTIELQKVVGLTARDGHELWLPPDPNNYKRGGGYSEGYSQTDVQQRNLFLAPSLASRLTEFIEVPLLGRGWRDVRPTAKLYDCHWFGFWMKDMINMGDTIDTSLRLASELIAEGPQTTSVSAGEIVTVGADFGTKSQPNPQPIHTYISLPQKQCLQVIGMNNVIAISPEIPTIQHYKETSRIEGFLSGSYFGQYTTG